MATFKPGHLHMERHALNKDDFSYNLCIDYKLDRNDKGETGMSFQLHGTVEEKTLDETFFLAKDQAFDFARHATRIAQKYGLPKAASIGSMHKYYDEMFEDVRHQLDVKPGDSMKPEHLE